MTESLHNHRANLCKDILMDFLRKPAVRWILFLPAAVLASLVSILAIRFFGSFWSDPDAENLTLFGAFGEATVMGVGCGVLIFVAAWMAPKGKLIVSVIIATLLGLLAVLGTIYSVLHHQYLMIITFGGAAFGIVSAVKIVSEEPPDIGG
jgi:hypothetical protein